MIGLGSPVDSCQVRERFPVEFPWRGPLGEVRGVRVVFAAEDRTGGTQGSTSILLPHTEGGLRSVSLRVSSEVEGPWVVLCLVYKRHKGGRSSRVCTTSIIINNKRLTTVARLVVQVLGSGTVVPNVSLWVVLCRGPVGLCVRRRPRPTAPGVESIGGEDRSLRCRYGEPERDGVVPPQKSGPVGLRGSVPEAGVFPTLLSGPRPDLLRPFRGRGPRMSWVGYEYVRSSDVV